MVLVLAKALRRGVRVHPRKKKRKWNQLRDANRFDEPSINAVSHRYLPSFSSHHHHSQRFPPLISSHRSSLLLLSANATILAPPSSTFLQRLSATSNSLKPSSTHSSHHAPKANNAHLEEKLVAGSVIHSRTLSHVLSILF